MTESIAARDKGYTRAQTPDVVCGVGDDWDRGLMVPDGACTLMFACSVKIVYRVGVLQIWNHGRVSCVVFSVCVIVSDFEFTGIRPVQYGCRFLCAVGSNCTPVQPGISTQYPFKQVVLEYWSILYSTPSSIPLE